MSTVTATADVHPMRDPQARTRLLRRLEAPAPMRWAGDELVAWDRAVRCEYTAQHGPMAPALGTGEMQLLTATAKAIGSAMTADARRIVQGAIVRAAQRHAAVVSGVHEVVSWADLARVARTARAVAG